MHPFTPLLLPLLKHTVFFTLLTLNFSFQVLLFFSYLFSPVPLFMCSLKSLKKYTNAVIYQMFY
jgi:hypothetical protein